MLPLSWTEGCHALDPAVGTSYGYYPSLGTGIAFCTLFGLSLLCHVGQAAWSRNWWCLTFAVGAVTELLGWAGRTWSADCPYNKTAFLSKLVSRTWIFILQITASIPHVDGLLPTRFILSLPPPLLF